MCGVIPQAIKSLGHDVRVITPKYREIRERRFGLRDVARLRSLAIEIGGKEFSCSVKSGFIPETKVQVYFIENLDMFDRTGLYADAESGDEWSDNCLRFTFFNHASLQLMLHLQWFPDIIHCNDWQSALIPYLILTDDRYADGFRHAKTFLHVHNPDQAGTFKLDPAVSNCLSTKEIDSQNPLVIDDKISFLKAGLLTADELVFTELNSRERLDNLDKVDAFINDILKSRTEPSPSIRIGIDRRTWNPSVDKYLHTNFSNEDFIDGKAENKIAFQREILLKTDPDIPLIAITLDQDKTDDFDLFVDIMRETRDINAQWVFSSKASKRLRKLIDDLTTEFSGSFVFHAAKDENFNHKMLSAADIFLTTGKIDIHSINLMHALIYGAVPVTLTAESSAPRVVDIDADADRGNGFVFTEKKSSAIAQAMRRAFALYESKDKWHLLQFQGISSDYTWERSVDGLVAQYKEVKDR